MRTPHPYQCAGISVCSIRLTNDNHPSISLPCSIHPQSKSAIPWELTYKYTHPAPIPKLLIQTNFHRRMAIATLSGTATSTFLCLLQIYSCLARSLSTWSPTVAVVVTSPRDTPIHHLALFTRDYFHSKI